MGRIGTMIAPCAPNVNLSGALRRVACATVGVGGGGGRTAPSRQPVRSSPQGGAKMAAHG